MRAGLILEPGDDRLADRRERPTSGLLRVSEDDLKPPSQIHEIRGVDLARVEAIHSYEGWNSSQIGGGCRGMDHASDCYREKARHARELAEAAWQPELESTLRRVAQEFDEAAEDIEAGEARDTELLPRD